MYLNVNVRIGGWISCFMCVSSVLGVWSVNVMKFVRFGGFYVINCGRYGNFGVI